MKWILCKVGVVVFISVCVDIALLYWQAKQGKRLPYKVRIIPTLDVGGAF